MWFGFKCADRGLVVELSRVFTANNTNKPAPSPAAPMHRSPLARRDRATPTTILSLSSVARTPACQSISRPPTTRHSLALSLACVPGYRSSCRASVFVGLRRLSSLPSSPSSTASAFAAAARRARDRGTTVDRRLSTPTTTVTTPHKSQFEV